MAGVFVSYRRDDSQGFAGRLADDLIEILGPDCVFRDIEIPIGSDFTDVLHRAIAASEALLVVIGRQWAGTSAQGSGSRLFDPIDWVRAEIEAALAQDKLVIPILVGGAEMPAADALPPSIRRLSRMQAAIMSDRHWDAEVRELAERLCTLCPSLNDKHSPPAAPAESPAQVLRDLGERVFDEVASRRRPRIEPPSLSRTFSDSVLRAFGRGLKRTLSAIFGLGLLYVGLRLFGDETVLRGLDRFEAHLLVGWERLQVYVARFPGK